MNNRFFGAFPAPSTFNPQVLRLLDRCAGLVRSSRHGHDDGQDDQCSTCQLRSVWRFPQQDNAQQH